MTATTPDALAVDDLRWFGLIAEAGGISQAARRFDAPKATLSRAIARVEATAGAPVFDRTGRGVRLTPLGEHLMPAAGGAIAAARDAEEALRSMTDAPAGPLRIAAGALSTLQLLTPVLRRLAGEHPAVRIDLRVTSRALDPIEEEIDVCLRIGRPDRPSLVARRILAGHLKLYGTPDALLGVDPSCPDEVAALERVIISVPSVPGEWVLTEARAGSADAPQTITLDRPPIASVNDPTVALDLVREGLGIVLVPALWGEPRVRAGELRAVLPNWLGPKLEVFAVMPPRRAAVPAVRAFLDMLVAHARAAIPGDPTHAVG